MKRRIAKVACLLLLGAMINVAMAWGLAASARVPSVLSPQEPSQWDWLKAQGWRPLPDYDGYTVINSTTRFAGFGVEYLAFLEREARRKRFEFGSFISFSASSAQCVQAGWPMRSMHGRAFEPSMITRTRIRGSGISLRGSDDLPILEDPVGSAMMIPYVTVGGREFGGRLAPLVPLWPGFAVNTLFYATVLWMLFCGPFALRRAIRRKRGLCERCAYRIGASGTCTECGAAIPTEAMP